MSRFERGKSTALTVVEPITTPEAEAQAAVENRMRYTMPIRALDNVQLAGMVASTRLLDLLTDEQTFTAMRPSDKLKAIELAMTQAFGRVTTAIEEKKANPQTNSDPKTIQLREKLVALGKVVNLPELKRAQQATDPDIA